jgi:hypothetical protein
MELNNSKNNNNLERFIRDNRDAFDHLEPDAALWNKIGEAIAEDKKTTTRVISMSWARWAVAATLFLALAGTLTYMLFLRPTSGSLPLAGKTEKRSEAVDLILNQIDPQYGKLVSQFMDVIGTKQAELKKMEKDDPALYQKFSGDIQKLDSSYHVLRSTLNANPNTELLLQAMISNLQLQIDLLNQQLAIIKQIKQPKSEKI